MTKTSIFAYAQLNDRIMPCDRCVRFEDPLQEALDGNGYGDITGGGTMQSKNGEIRYCGIDIDLYDIEKGVPFICDFLAHRGAPKGSKLQYTVDEQQVEVAFGVLEGLALYLNGTDLPDSIYSTCSAQEVYDSINQLLGDRGAIHGQWQGPRETALYLYGHSVDEMRQLINDFITSYPLCQKARMETIA